MKKTIIYGFLGLLYGSFIIFFGTVIHGGGHGNPFPLMISSSPLSVFSLPPINLIDIEAIICSVFFWPLITITLSRTHIGRLEYFFIVLILMHYAGSVIGIIILLKDSGLHNLYQDLTGKIFYYVLFWFLIYLTGQTLIIKDYIFRNTED